jgi:hypothetical protein
MSSRLVEDFENSDVTSEDSGVVSDDFSKNEVGEQNNSGVSNLPMQKSHKKFQNFSEFSSRDEIVKILETNNLIFQFKNVFRVN